jgi:hypothetical protein
MLRSVVLFSYSGCLIPLLLVLNLLFGWMFLSFRHWLLVEAALFLLFIIHSFIFTRRMLSRASQQRKGDVIDVEAEVVEDRDSFNRS